MKNIMIIIVLISGLLSCTDSTVQQEKARKKQGPVLMTHKPLIDSHIRVHYFRKSNKYKNWGLHLWGSAIKYKVSWNKPVPFDTQDDWGAFTDVKIDDLHAKLGFVIHRGEERDSKNREISGLDKLKEIWIIQGVDEIFMSQPDKQKSYLQSATLDGKDIITLEFNDNTYLRHEAIEVRDATGTRVAVKGISAEGNSRVVLDVSIDPAQTYTVHYENKVLKAGLSPAFIDAVYFYNGDDLGATFKDNTLNLKLWAPLAQKVSVIFFDKKDQYTVASQKAMTRQSQGVWAYEEKGEFSLFEGRIYQYSVTIQGRENRVLDPYAKGMAVFENSKKDPVGKAAIVDPAKYKVKAFANIPAYQKREDAVIYEIHVRDFTAHPSAKTSAPFGTYTAFIEKLPYLKELGVTHIQLLPVQNYYYSDETKKDREWDWSARGNNYNWGYDPQSYFTPEGMYSEHPEDPASRIRELKALINAIHELGMGVILDVVYNHTCKSDLFENFLPGYSYRLDSNGEFSSKSGCGNDVASTHLMMRKLITDSLKYWTREYKVDGFRFDLMGLTDTDTMDQAAREIYRINPQSLLLGEGWRMYNGARGTSGADQGWMKDTDAIAVFSDSFRETVKGFLTGKKQSQDNVFKNISGNPRNFTADDPGDSVQYIAAHDGLTWHDTLAYNMKLDPEMDRKEIYQRLKLGNFMVLTSQGIAFLHGGQEMGRTKMWKGPGQPNGENQGMYIRNSYDSSDRINSINWALVMEDQYAKALFEYTRGLIKLRKSLEAFRIGDSGQIESRLRLLPQGEGHSPFSLAYTIKTLDGSILILAINAGTSEQIIDCGLDLSSAVILADGDSVSLSGIGESETVKIEGSTLRLDALSAVIIRI